jgi:hypothetical protein
MRRIAFFATALAFGLLIVFDAVRLHEFRGYPALLSLYEVAPAELAYDFDKDGQLEKVSLEQSVTGIRLTIRSKEHLILQIPYSWQNANSRTHLALRAGRVLVFDAINQKSPSGVVYAWDGHELKPARPDAAEADLLRAMAAVDDGGSYNSWTIYFLARPVIACLLLVLLVLASGLAPIRSSKQEVSQRTPEIRPDLRA